MSVMLRLVAQRIVRVDGVLLKWTASWERGTSGGLRTNIVRADLLAEDAVILDHFDDWIGPASSESQTVVIDVGEELFDDLLVFNDAPRSIDELPCRAEFCLRPKPVVM